MSFIVFDIETGPLPDEVLLERIPTWQGPQDPGAFDEKTVKLGNTLDSEKVQAKIEAAREKHSQAVRDYHAALKDGRESHLAECRDEAPLKAEWGQILAIGYAAPLKDEDISVRIDGDQEDESHMLEQFWGQYKRCAHFRSPMVGHCIKTFDVPFIMRRSWMLGVTVPPGVMQGRYLSGTFVDTNELWQCGNWKHPFIKLDDLAIALGSPLRKLGHGEDFHKLWNGSPVARKEAVAYLNRDLEMTVDCARRMGMQ